MLLSYGFTLQPANPSDRFWLDVDVELLEVGTGGEVALQSHA